MKSLIGAILVMRQIVLVRDGLAREGGLGQAVAFRVVLAGLPAAVLDRAGGDAARKLESDPNSSRSSWFDRYSFVVAVLVESPLRAAAVASTLVFPALGPVGLQVT
jgi:hypothetical protein